MPFRFLLLLTRPHTALSILLDLTFFWSHTTAPVELVSALVSRSVKTGSSGHLVLHHNLFQKYIFKTMGPRGKGKTDKKTGRGVRGRLLVAGDDPSAMLRERVLTRKKKEFLRNARAIRRFKKVRATETRKKKEILEGVRRDPHISGSGGGVRGRRGREDVPGADDASARRLARYESFFQEDDQTKERFVEGRQVSTSKNEERHDIRSLESREGGRVIDRTGNQSTDEQAGRSSSSANGGRFTYKSRKRRRKEAAAVSGESRDKQLPRGEVQRDGRHQRPDAFRKERKAQEKKLEEREEARREESRKKKAMRARKRERKQRTKALARRSRRGQPLMKHAVANILDKLQRGS